jgi:SAM-dependent methyltransferase
MDGDCLYPVIERYGEGRAILDLGCGPGATANEIDGSYVWYTGVDISRVALEKARLRSIENQRNLRCEYIRSDMALYEPNRRYDVIVFGDSLYYVPRKKIPEMLRRYAGYLSPTGVFIARIKGVRSEWFSDGVPEGREGARWTTQRSVVSIIRKECAVIESRLYAYSEMICVIVFCPLSR